MHRYIVNNYKYRTTYPTSKTRLNEKNKFAKTRFDCCGIADNVDRFYLIRYY